MAAPACQRTLSAWSAAPALCPQVGGPAQLAFRLAEDDTDKWTPWFVEQNEQAMFQRFKTYQ